MKIKWNNKYVCWGVTAFLVIASGLLFYYFLFHRESFYSGFVKIYHILTPVVAGMAIAYVLLPVLNFFERRVWLPLLDKLKIKNAEKKQKYGRTLSILTTTILTILVIYLLFYMMISQIVPSVQQVISDYDIYVTNTTAWFNKILEDNPSQGAYIVNLINKYSAEFEKWLVGIMPQTTVIIKTITSSVVSVLGFLWNFVIGFIISIYVLASKEKFGAQAKKSLYAIFTNDTANAIIRNLRFANKTFVGFLGGKVVDSIIIGLLCFIGTTLMGTPYAALVSLIIGVTNIVPFFGPYLGAVPSVLLIFMVNPMQPLNCVYFIIFILLLQQFDGNILGPKILGESTGLTGFWVIFAITLFGGLLGIFGMIIGVPSFAILYAAFKAIINIKLEKKGLPIATEEYGNLDYIDREGLHEIPVKQEPVKVKTKKEKPAKGTK